MRKNFNTNFREMASFISIENHIVSKVNKGKTSGPDILLNNQWHEVHVTGPLSIPWKIYNRGVTTFILILAGTLYLYQRNGYLVEKPSQIPFVQNLVVENFD